MTEPIETAVGASRQLTAPRFAERWLALAYTFSGTFVLNGTDLTSDRVRSDFHALHVATLRRRRRRWPRGIARFLLVPIYCAASFRQETRDYLFGCDGPGRWAVAMKPALFDCRRNHVEAKHAAQNNTLLHYQYLQMLFADGVATAARYFGHPPEMTTGSGGPPSNLAQPRYLL